MLKTVSRPRLTSSELLLLLLIICYAVLVYLYMVFRFDGLWGEGDTLVVTRGIVSSIQSQSLLNTRYPYNNGIGFVAIIIFLTQITGVSPLILQTFVLAPLSAFSVIVVFVTYRSLLRNTKVALLATFFLYLQPEFLWVTWR